MSETYKEPELTIVTLDYAKPIESRLCLQSIKDHVKFPHKVIFCDNGSGEDYAMDFVRDGLVDQLIVNRESHGLGVGTRDIIAACFSPYFLMLQNDQIIGRDFHESEFHSIVGALGVCFEESNGVIQSVSVAGSPCGKDIYSERAGIMETAFYKGMEESGILGYNGAGPYHDTGPWREAQIQALYREDGYVHFEWPHPLVIDNGVYAVRDMKDGGTWVHRTDSKALWCIVSPTVKNPAYPKLSDEEFALAARGEWPDGKIPSIEIKDSFRCWDHTLLAQMQDDYVKDLRRRFAAKR